MSEWGESSVGPDNVSEWGDISICWSGIRIMCPSGVTYLSVGPESG